MTSSRSFWVAALAIVIAALGVGTSTSVASTPGVGGFVTDADTGLPLAQSTVTWTGTTPSTAPATSDPSGRYVFYGLQPGETGSLSVVGPPGWEPGSLAGVVVPTSDVNVQDFALHRDWASTAGGAQAATNDDSGAGAGCPAGAALDNDLTSAWSASAARPVADPPSLTITLPQAIDVTQVVLDAGSACGHDAGAALGRFRIETSADGSSWATAFEGTLGPADRGIPTEESPTANAAGVRFVRLVALAPQDPASSTIDVREVRVHGAGPNVPPTGTITTDSLKRYITQVVRLQASFTDPDSSIVHYLWDFDGDGKWDQVTYGPSVSHVWAGPGTYHVTVGARDFRGGLGTASLTIRIDDPNQPIEPIPQRKPLITFLAPTGIDLFTRIACASKCTFTAKMTVTAGMARKLHLKHRTILTFKRHTQGPGLGSWTLELPQKVIKKARAANLRKLKVRLTCSAIDQQKRRSTVHRWVTFS